MPESTDHQAWVAVLDSLEANAASPGQPDDVVPVPWHPPAGLGPLPADLVERAELISDRQRQAVDVLQAAARDNRQHSALLSAVSASTPRRGAVYLDVAG